MSTHEVVILGASYAGLNLAHDLAKKAIPSITKVTGQKFHITLISFSDHFLHSVATPRAVVDTSLIPIEKTFVSIPDNLPYSTDVLTYVHAEVKSFDFANKNVSFTTLDSSYKPINDSSIQYDSLFITLGAHTKHPAYKLRGSHFDNLTELQKLNSQITAANSIVIAGGGPVALETAGEITSKYGKSKAVTILTNGPKLLHNLTTDVGSTAQSILESQGAHVTVNAAVSSATPLPDGRTRIEFGKGESIDADLYIDATGVVPNSGPLPKDVLNPRGFLIVDEHLRATTAGPFVYGLGDIIGGLASIAEIIFSKPVVVANWTFDVSGGKVGQEKVWSTPKHSMMVVPLGTKKGIMTAFGWRFPSFFAWLIKGRNYMIDKAIVLVKVGA